MGAKYIYSVMGSHPTSLRPLMEASHEIVPKVIGGVFDSVTFSTNWKEKSYAPDDKDVFNIQLKPKQSILFHSTSLGFVQFIQYSGCWSYQIGCEVDGMQNPVQTSQVVFTELWSSLKFLQPKFAIAGIEIFVTFEEYQKIVSRQMNPLLLYSCHQEIVSEELQKDLGLIDDWKRTPTGDFIFVNEFYFDPFGPNGYLVPPSE